MKELWKDVLKYEGLYQVSTEGRFRVKCNSGWELVPVVKGTGGYLYVWLSLNSKRKKLLAHRIVAQVHLPNPLYKPYVILLDCNKENISVRNLGWATRREVSDHARKHNRYNGKSVQVYCKETNTYYRSMKFAESELGLPKGTVRKSIEAGFKCHGYTFIRQVYKNTRRPIPLFSIPDLAS